MYKKRTSRLFITEESFGSLVRRYRKKSGLTMEALAPLVGKTSLSQLTYEKDRVKQVPFNYILDLNDKRTLTFSSLFIF